MVTFNIGGGRPDRTGNVRHHYRPVRRRNRKLGLGGAILFALVGIGLLIGGGFMLKSSADLAKNGIRVNGKVIRVDSRYDREDGDTLYRPVISYETEAGEKREYASNVWSGTVKYDVGNTAPVIYDPNNSRRVSVGDATSQWGAPAIMLGMGVIFLLVGAVTVVKRRKTGGAAPTLPPDQPGSPPGGPGPAGEQPPQQAPSQQPPEPGTSGTSGRL